MEIYEGSYHLHKRGKYWYWKKPEEKTFHTTKQTNKTLARAYVHQILTEGHPNKLILQEYAKDFYVWDQCAWIKRQKAKGKSFNIKMAQARRSQLERYIFPKFGNYKLQKINAVEFENWLLTLPLSNGTRNSIMYTLNIILKEARREGLIKYNPLQDAEPLANEYKKRDAFTQEEIEILFPYDIDDLIKIWGNLYNATLFYTVLTSGMRIGEAIALPWRNILLDKGAILINQAVKADNSIGKPKSNDVRGVILPGRAITILRKWKEESIRNDEDDYVFYGLDPSDPHKPVHRRSALKWFKEGLERAGISTEGRNLVVHSLRHTYNTRMRTVLPEEILHYMIGHKSRSMTDRYDQSTPEERIKDMITQKKLIDASW